MIFVSNSYELPQSLQLPSLSNIEFSTIDNSQNACNTSLTGALNCDDYHSTSCYNNGALNESSPICCTGYESCKLATIITANINNIDDNLICNTSFRADAYYSVYQKLGTIMAPSGGNMYFSGYLNRSSSATITNTDMFDIVGSGHDALRSKTINTARNVYCLGYWSCFQSIISNIFNNIYAYGFRSLKDASVDNILGDIYCGTGEACDGLKAFNIGGNIIAVGKKVLYDCEIANVTGTLVAYGSSALESANIRNVNNVCTRVHCIGIFI